MNKNGKIYVGNKDSIVGQKSFHPNKILTLTDGFKKYLKKYNFKTNVLMVYVISNC